MYPIHEFTFINQHSGYRITRMNIHQYPFYMAFTKYIEREAKEGIRYGYTIKIINTKHVLSSIYVLLSALIYRYTCSICAKIASNEADFTVLLFI